VLLVEEQIFIVLKLNFIEPLVVNASRAIDGFAPWTDSAAPSIDPSMAQQSIDGATLSTDPIWCCSESSHLFLVLRL